MKNLLSKNLLNKYFKTKWEKLPKKYLWLSITLSIILSVFMSSQAISQAQNKNSQNKPGNSNNATSHYSPSTNNTALTPDDALKRLMEGNKRFMKEKIVCPVPNEIAARRLETANIQRPFAVILGCSDSRVPPEFVFDQGIADLFVVRIAGNVVNHLELDSIKYSAIHNDSKIVVVLGHQNCGAVEAVMNDQGNEIPSIANLIEPSLYNMKHEKVSLKDGIIANVKNSVNIIKNTSVISKLIKDNKIKVVGAYYDFETGEVQIVTE